LEVWGVNPGGNEIFHACLDQPWCTLSQVSFPGVKQWGYGVEQPSPFSAKVKERVEFYFYSPSGSSSPVLPLPFIVGCDVISYHMFPQISIKFLINTSTPWWKLTWRLSSCIQAIISPLFIGKGLKKWETFKTLT
jgi:hypothetical protein